MKTTILAAAAVLTLGVGGATAQGAAGAQPTIYGSVWAANQRARQAARQPKAAEAAPTKAHTALSSRPANGS